MTRQPSANSGGTIDSVGWRQRRRKIHHLQQSCKDALWFTDSFGIDLISIAFNVQGSNEKLSVPFSSSLQCSSSSLSANPSTTDSSRETRLQRILYLLDRFGVSDKFYHELSMVNDSLPRSYKIKKARECISANVELKRLPKPFSGCYRSFQECLLESLSVEVELLILCIHSDIHYILVHNVYMS